MRLWKLASLLIAFAGCSTALGEMEDHQALWAQQGPASYRYTYHQGGALPSMQLQVTVTSGAVTDTSVVSSDLPDTSGIKGQTVEQLFSDLENRLRSDCDVTVSYDEALGYPLSVYSDCSEEGDGWDVSNLSAL